MACNNCGSIPCQCRGSSLTPVPFYAQAPACAESHTQNVYINQFAVGLQVQSAWNIPVCGGAAILTVPGVTTVPVGEYIHNPTYGYFLITAFDASTGQLSIQNPCLTGNAAPGTAVSECTVFVVTPAPVGQGTVPGQTGVCIKFDFVAPVVNGCVDVIVTSQDGLIVGYNVQIGSGVYFLSAVSGGNVITICNHGSGITPGTPVIAQNIEGQYQYCLVIISVSACAQTVVQAGKVMVCDSNTPTTISGGANLELLQLQDFTTGVARYVARETAIQPILCAMIQNVCCPQVTMGDVSLQFISHTVTFTAKNFQYVFPTPIRTLVFSDGCNHAVESCVTVAALIDFDGSPTQPTPVLGEITLVWDNVAAPFTFSKMVWQELFEDGWGTSGVIPGDAQSVQMQLPTPAPRFPMMYHAQHINSYSVFNGNGTINLGGSVRLAVGDDNPPANMYGVSIMLSGWLKIFRV